MKTILIVTFLILAFAPVFGQEKAKQAQPDSTIQKVAVKDLITELDTQRKQVIDEANSRVIQITAQIQLLQYLKSDSVNVPKVKK